MISISCSTKFHAFALAEQMQRKSLLHQFHTSYAYQKNTIARKFVSRIDKETIDTQKIRTYLPIAVGLKIYKKPYFWNSIFDQQVSRNISKDKLSKVFIGWSGMSLNAINAAKKTGKITILERGSSHISFQDKILREEYKKFGIDFKIDANVHQKELEEYEAVDYISIPSLFVKRSFLEYGIDEKKLLVNPYGVSSFFTTNKKVVKKDKFIILYLGGLMIRKGLIYFFEALKQLNVNKKNIEVWFIGGIRPELQETIDKYKESNWTFWGFINHYELPNYIFQADVAVMPSLEEGLSTVIPQMLACGVPVIATENTGGGMVIEDGVNGYLVPIRNSEAITMKLENLYTDSNLLQKLKKNTKLDQIKLSWDSYGDRYANNVLSMIENR